MILAEVIGFVKQRRVWGEAEAAFQSQRLGVHFKGSTIKATTLHHYKNALRAYVLPKFEERKITEINREDIQN